ncbi:hypothetical protein BASA81_018256 [Batrachochytrium salamandrivorans]|nr:hypothetical protein BASA81_018256 [Batrachochytrium salamandrivorans]
MDNESYKERGIDLSKGPYKGDFVSNFNILHVLEGVVTRVFEVISSRRNKTFLERTKLLGNRVLGAHHSVALALVQFYEEFPNESQIKMDCEVACLLMQIIYICKDDCMGLLLDDFKACLERFEELVTS